MTNESDERPASGTERPHQPFVTSVRVERSSGPHEYVSVWIRGANVGTLCVGRGDGEALRDLLLAAECRS